MLSENRPVAKARTVGMIVPPREGWVPPEAHMLYPEGINFVASGLGLEVMEKQAFTEALKRIPAAIESLRTQGAEVICLMGTSISFYLGREKHQELLSQMRTLAAGLPVSTMTDAVIHGLRAQGMQNIVVASAYTPQVSQALVSYLRAEGFDVLADKHLEISKITALEPVGTRALAALGSELFRSEPDCDGLLISCGGLRTSAATELLELIFRKPVVSSAIQGCHHAVSLLDQVGREHA